MRTVVDHTVTTSGRFWQKKLRLFIQRWRQWGKNL